MLQVLVQKEFVTLPAAQQPKIMPTKEEKLALKKQRALQKKAAAVEKQKQTFRVKKPFRTTIGLITRSTLFLGFPWKRAQVYYEVSRSIRRPLGKIVWRYNQPRSAEKSQLSTTELNKAVGH